MTLQTTTSRRENTLSTPASPQRLHVPHVGPDTFGAMSESVARFFGTSRFLVLQTVIVIIWIILNLVAASVRWDPYPFILPNLAFSTQAASAAPLILLAQNRPPPRDRIPIPQTRKPAHPPQ